MNIRLFEIINSLSGRYYGLDQLMIFSAEWLGYFLIMLLVAPLMMTLFIRNDRISSWARTVLWKWSYYKDMLAISLVSAIIARFVFVNIIRYFYYNPRPFEVFDGINQLINHEVTGSFPSGHATFFFALAAGVYLYNKKAGILYVIAATLIGFARIFCGVHWPLDIVGGAALGSATAVLAYYLKQKMPQGSGANIWRL